jgi:hypothetical protein
MPVLGLRPVEAAVVPNSEPFCFAFPGEFVIDGVMKCPATLALGVLLSVQIGVAEPHTFTNTEGKSVEAEMVALSGTTVVMKLPSRKIAKVDLSSLTEADQAFVKAWWETNKNKLKAMDVRLTLDKNTKQIERKVTRSGGNGGKGGKPGVQKRMSKDEVFYSGEIKSFAKKDIEDLRVRYTIHKRTSTRNGDGSQTETEEIDGETMIRHLPSLGTAAFETEVLECLDESQSGGGKPRTSHSDTIIGIVVKLSVGGEVFLTQSYPDNFLARLEEEAKREEKLDEERADREEKLADEHAAREEKEAKHQEKLAEERAKRAERLAEEQAAREE